MSSSEGKTSSGSSLGGGKRSKGPIDDKKRRRMESNRESARRSRLKKQQQLDDFLKQMSHLNRENAEIENKIGEIAGMLETYDSQNEALKAVKNELQLKLENLETIIDISVDVRGSDDVINDSDPMFRPWQLPYLSVPVFAASSGARFFSP